MNLKRGDQTKIANLANQRLEEMGRSDLASVTRKSVNHYVHSPSEPITIRGQVITQLIKEFKKKHSEQLAASAA